MSQKKSVRACVAGLVFVCALTGIPAIAAQADTVVSTIDVGAQPVGVAINPGGSQSRFSR